MMNNQKFFAPCPRGLETILAAELEQLGAADVMVEPGGVHFSGEYRFCYRANLESRIASRILWQVGRYRYQTEDDVYKSATALPWNEWFDVMHTIRVNLAAIKCPLKSLDFVTLRIKDAVCDKFRSVTGRRPSVDTREPDVRIHAFLNEREVSLYLDTSGEPLFKRGLRRASVAAPLRENLAAGILKLAGWEPSTALLDPMCGSGTFLLEAAQVALDMAPGLGRKFGFEKLNNFDAGYWKELRQQAVAKQKPKTPLPVFGSDLYGSALDTARANLVEAGLDDVISLKQASVLEISAPSPHGMIVTNPPYGVRVGEEQALAEFYPKLGNVLKQKFAGWRAYIFTADLRLAKLIHLTASRRTPLYNGALECRLFEYKLVAGTMRREKAAPGNEKGRLRGPS